MRHPSRPSSPIALAACGLLAAVATVPTSAQVDTALAYTTTAASLQLIPGGDGGYLWVERRPGDVYAVLSEDFSAIGELAVDEDSLRSGTTVTALDPAYRLEPSQPNFLVERTGEFVLQVVYGADGTVLRRTARPRYTQTYPLLDGRLVVQERDGATGEETLVDFQSLGELGRFPERVVHTAVTGEDVWVSRAQAVARVYGSDLALRSEVAVPPAARDSTPGFALGLLAADVGADGLVDFEIRYAEGAGEERELTRYRVFDETGAIHLDTLEPAGVAFAVTNALDGLRRGDVLLAGYGAGRSYVVAPGDPLGGKSLETTSPAVARVGGRSFVLGPRNADLSGAALVYDDAYDLRRVIEPTTVATLVGDTALSAFAFAAVGERGTPFAASPLAWVSYRDPEDLADTRFTLTDLGGEPTVTLPAEALTVTESDTAVYLVVDRGGPRRARGFEVYAMARPPAEPSSPPEPDTPSTGPGVDTTSSLPRVARAPAFSVSPNPATDVLAVVGEGMGGDLVVDLLAADGRRVVRRRHVVPGERLPVGDLPAGTYLLRVWAGGKPQGVRRVVVSGR